MAIFVIFVVFVSENKYDDDDDLSLAAVSDYDDDDDLSLAAVSDTRGLVLYSEQICLKFGM